VSSDYLGPEISLDNRLTSKGRINLIINLSLGGKMSNDNLQKLEEEFSDETIYQVQLEDDGDDIDPDDEEEDDFDDDDEEEEED
jgi:hypothetical protein